MANLFNIDAERAILSAVLHKPTAIWDAAEFVNAKSFYDPAHREIWMALETAAKENDLITDQIHLIAVMESTGFSPSITLITNIAGDFASAANIKTYGKIVRDHAHQREAVRVMQEAQIAVDGGEGLDGTLADLEGALRGITQHRQKGDAQAVDQVISEAMEQVDMVASSKERILGVDTGIDQINDLTGGLMKSDLYVLAARPSMGKTALALSMAYHASKETPVLFFSMEMSALQLGQRMLSMVSEVPLVRLRTGREQSAVPGQYNHLGEQDIERIAMAAGEVSSRPIHIDDTAILTPASMRSSIERVSRKREVGLVVVDYIQLMSSSSPRQSDIERVSEASRWCKLMAKEFNVPIVALSQLNRQCEERNNKRPMLSDLRQSGAIEQDADAVLFLYRPSVYNERGQAGEDLTHVAELIVGKQRNGPLGTVPVRWEPKSATFSTFRGI